MTTKKQTDGHIGRQVNVRLKDQDAERLDRLTAKHGGVSATIKAALKALEGANELTNAELVATIAARLKDEDPKEASNLTVSRTGSPISPNPVKENQTRTNISTPPRR